MKLPEIIGVAGGNASGKDTLADLRAELQGAQKIGLSDLLRAEAVRLGFDPTKQEDRKILSAIANQWAEEYGHPGFLSIRAIEQYRAMEAEQQTGLSLVSIRRLAEAAIIQSEGGLMIWVEASEEKRYENYVRRARPGEDISWAKFKADNDREMYGDPNNPLAPRMIEVKEAADLHIENEAFTTSDEYKAYLIKAFELAA